MITWISAEDLWKMLGNTKIVIKKYTEFGNIYKFLDDLRWWK